MFIRTSILVFVMVAAAMPVNKSMTAAQEPCAPVEGETVTIEEAYLYVEFNFTDGDIGVHGSFDDDGWSELCVYDPTGNQILWVTPESQLGEQAIGGIFFESREPELDEFGFDELYAAFPEGQYEVRGVNHDGTRLSGFASFTHDVPAAPTIILPQGLADDEEAGQDVALSTENFVVEWEPVTETVDGQPVTITGYEVIITLNDYDDPNGFSRPVFDVHVLPDRTRLSISPEFWEPETLYEIEILALEQSGNQTISLGFFTSE